MNEICNHDKMEDWVHVLRYVPILQDHSSAVAMLGILYLDMPALVRIVFMDHHAKCNHEFSHWYYKTLHFCIN